MTDYTKHNAKIAQEFWKKVEEGANAENLWGNHIEIHYLEPGEMIGQIFDFGHDLIKFTWKPEISANSEVDEIRKRLEKAENDIRRLCESMQRMSGNSFITDLGRS